MISNKSGILTSVGSDEPVQPHFKLRNSKIIYAGCPNFRGINVSTFLRLYLAMAYN